MNTKEVKAIRGQVRQAVKEEMPTVLNEQLMVTLEAKMQERLNFQLKLINEHIKSVLEQIDNRSKEVLSYMVRQSTPQVSSVITEDNKKGETQE